MAVYTLFTAALHNAYYKSGETGRNSIIEKTETEAEEKGIQTSEEYEDNFAIEKIP